MQLTEQDIHIWLVDREAVDAAMIADYRALMNEQELARNQRYRFEHSRFGDCVTRALARTVLSTYVDVDPAAWEFNKGDHGKPEIDGPVTPLPLRFNLSHSQRYVVCAVTCNHDIGVDIECTGRDNDVLNIADRYFSKSEVEDLFDLPEHQQHERFFDYWTLKEAYMKARGEGIALGLGNFSFTLARGSDIAITFSVQIDDNPQHWYFDVFDPKPDHRLAVALHQPRGGAVRCRLFETVPLTDTCVEIPLVGKFRR